MTDLGNFFWSETRGRTMKDLVLEALPSGTDASQFTCPFHHFGSCGYDKQPGSIRECLTKRSAGMSEVRFGSSVVRLEDLVHIKLKRDTASE